MHPKSALALGTGTSTVLLGRHYDYDVKWVIETGIDNNKGFATMDDYFRYTGTAT